MLVPRKTLPKILTLAASLTLPSWSFADDGPSVFDQLDTNKDGVVTLEEVPEDKRRLFEKILKSADKDSDGKLTREEFKAIVAAREANRDGAPRGEGGERKRDGGAPREGGAPRDGGERKGVPGGREGRPEGPVGDRPDPAQIIQRLDTNGDGKISKDEAQGPLQEHFARLDANSDGFVNAEELRQGFEKMAVARGGGVEGKRSEGDRPMGDRGAVERRGMFQAGPLMMAIDTNKDGELSAEEIANASANLAKLDKDGDGKISREEFFAAMGRPSEGKQTGQRDGAGGDRPAVERGERAGGRPAGDGAARGRERAGGGDRPRNPDNAPQRDGAPRDPSAPRESR